MMRAHRFLRGLRIAVLVLGAGAARADGPAFLVENIHRAPDPRAASWPDMFADLGPVTLFTAIDVEHGRELWRTDGTAAGTALLRDIFPGPADGVRASDRAVVMDGVAYFAASDDGSPPALWRSDGTARGTFSISTATPSSMVGLGHRLMFMNGSDLWRSDGSRAGTVRVKEFVGSYLDPSLTVVGDTLFFVRYDDEGGSGLWASDGTEAGTRLVARVRAGDPDAGSATSLIAAANQLFFVARDAASGAELWRSDGTEAGTRLVKDINPGAASAFYFNDYAEYFDPFFAALDDALLFIADDGASGLELWRSDGTAAGTSLVRDIVPGPLGLAGVVDENGEPTGIRDLRLVAAGGRAWLTADPRNQGVRLWTSDGTTSGTTSVTTIGSTSEPMDVGFVTPSGTSLFFATIAGTGATTLWASDGTAGGTVAPHEFAGSVWPIHAALGGVLLGANDGRTGNEPWYSDGTAAGTRPLGDLLQAEGSSNPRDLTDLNGVLLFTADDGIHGRELWRSGGVPGSTALVVDIRPGPDDAFIESLTVAGGFAYFSADDGVHGFELWRSDGTAAGTALVADLNPGPESSRPGRLIARGDTLFFYADDGVHGRELWRSDGSAAGTALVADLQPGAESSDPDLHFPNATQQAVIGDTVYFAAAATTGGESVWYSDGSAAGTGVLGDDLLPLDLTAVDGTLFFFTWPEHSAPALWRSDGTDAGTVLLRKVRHAGSAVAAGGRLYFISNNHRLWSSDGTTAGTGALPDVPEASGAQLASAGDSAFMLTAGQLFRPGAGTLVRSPAGDFNFLGGVADRIVFAEAISPWGRVDALWTTDGTAESTRPLQTLAPPPARGYEPNVERPQFTASGAYVYFSADVDTPGRELWAVPVSALPEIVPSGELPPPVPPCDPEGTPPCTQVQATRAAGVPGEQVRIDFVLRAPNEPIAGIKLDAELGAGLGANCTENADIGKESTRFAPLPIGCIDTDTCTGFRAVVLSLRDVAPIPDGAVLFSCTVDIAADAEPGAYPLYLLDVEGSDPFGNAVEVSARNGEIAVLDASQSAANSGDGASAGGAGAGGCAIDSAHGGAPLWLIAAVLLAAARSLRRVARQRAAATRGRRPRPCA